MVVAQRVLAALKPDLVLHPLHRDAASLEACVTSRRELRRCGSSPADSEHQFGLGDLGVVQCCCDGRLGFG